MVCLNESSVSTVMRWIGWTVSAKKKPFIPFDIRNIHVWSYFRLIQLFTVGSPQHVVSSWSYTLIFPKEDSPVTQIQQTTHNILREDRWFFEGKKKGKGRKIAIRINHRLVSRGVIPIIPSIQSYDIGHISSGKDYRSISTPSSSKPHPPWSTDTTIHKRKSCALIHRLSSMSCDGSTDARRNLLRYWNNCAVLPITTFSSIVDVVRH